MPTPAEPKAIARVPIDGRRVGRRAIALRQWPDERLPLRRGYVNLLRSQVRCRKSPRQSDSSPKPVRRRYIDAAACHCRIRGDCITATSCRTRASRSASIGPEGCPGHRGPRRHFRPPHGLVPTRTGWWPELVGPGHGVDTRQFRVLGIDYLGGRGGSPRRTPAADFRP